MSNARNLADVITGNFDVPLGALDNVPPSNDASALTTGTLPVGRLPSSGVDASSLTAGTLGTARLPAGSVLQMVNATTSSSISTASSSDVASGFSVTITPTDAANKIFIQMAGGGLDYGGSASGYGLQVSVYRNGTKLADIAGGTYGNPYGLSLSGSFVDSTHSSTSALTYQLYLRSGGGVTGYLINSGSSVTRPLVLTAMEIAA